MSYRDRPDLLRLDIGEAVHGLAMVRDRVVRGDVDEISTTHIRAALGFVRAARNRANHLEAALIGVLRRRGETW